MSTESKVTRVILNGSDNDTRQVFTAFISTSKRRGNVPADLIFAVTSFESNVAVIDARIPDYLVPRMLSCPAVKNFRAESNPQARDEARGASLAW